MNHVICKTLVCDLETNPDLREFGKHWGRGFTRNPALLLYSIIQAGKNEVRPSTSTLVQPPARPAEGSPDRVS